MWESNQEKADIIFSIWVNNEAQAEKKKRLFLNQSTFREEIIQKLWFEFSHTVRFFQMKPYSFNFETVSNMKLLMIKIVQGIQ